jgi:hypothetical protein
MFDCSKYDQYISKLFINFNFLVIFVQIQKEEFLHVGMLTQEALFIHFKFFIVLVSIQVGVEQILFLFCFHFVKIIVFCMSYLAA